MEEYKHVCRLCNKKYPSGKSLGGHMRSHVIANTTYVPIHKLKSKKGLTFSKNKVGGSGAYGLREKPKKTWRVESNSDDGGESRSAKEERYRAIALIDSFSVENGCSSDDRCEIEQEEVALWLMMLSRDCGNNRVGFGFSTESSDNNSIVLEAKSSSKRKNLSCLSSDKKVGCVEMDNSDSGYFENGAKEVESDGDSVDGYARNCGIKNPKGEFRSGYGVDECEFGKRSKKNGNQYSENTPIAHVEGGDDLKNKKRQNDHLSPQNAGKYKCSICQRGFKTHQALGGHILTHKRGTKDGLSGFKNRENGENSSRTSKFGAKSISKAESQGGESSSKKGHCCPYCPKVFKSGQALGGHKRSHLMGRSSQDKASQVRQFVEDSPPEKPHLLLDLNLPPSSVEENGSNCGGGSPRLLF